MSGRNVLLMSQSGERILSCNVGGGPELDMAILSGFCSSINTFGGYAAGLSNKNGGENGDGAGSDVDEFPDDELDNSSFGDRGELRAQEPGRNGTRLRHSALNSRSRFLQFTSHGEQFALKSLGSFNLVLHGPTSDGTDLCGRLLFELESVLLFMLGPYEKWTRQTLNSLEGLRDIVQGVVDGVLRDPANFIGGIPVIPKDSTVGEKLDQVLGSLENDDVTLGTMLLLENAVLHSRLNVEETRLVRMLVTKRPLEGHEQSRACPVFAEGQWKNLILYRMKWHTLCVLIHLQSPIAPCLVRVRRFEARIDERTTQLKLPISKTYTTVGDYCTLDVLGFMYHDLYSSNTFSPSMREDPTQALHEEVFMWFLKRAQDQLYLCCSNTVTLTKGIYSFFATKEDGYAMYLLCGCQIDMPEEAERLKTLIRTSID